jgi:hypothetical protein
LISFKKKPPRQGKANTRAVQRKASQLFFNAEGGERETKTSYPLSVEKQLPAKNV